MGIIVGKFRRKKTTYEVLENLDEEIKTIEEYRRNTEQTHKRIVGRFIVISVIVYLFTAFTFYFYFFPATFYDRLFYIIPLILAPVIILTVKRVLSIYYKWKIARKQNKLSSLRTEKKKMLERVMETETYKVAKTILEKFAPETISTRKSTPLIPSDLRTPLRSHTGAPTPSTVAMTGGLRQRALPAPPSQQLVPSTPSMIPPAPASTARTSLPGSLPPAATVMSTPLPLPRAILPRDRSVFDRMVDYLVGDGPTNRFALICRNCFSHNGMAFREEFEYISFRCCYCYSFNPARKQRPVAPKLEFDLKSPHIQSLSDTSESEKQSPSDTDSDSEGTLPLRTTTIQDVSDDTLEENKIVETQSESVEEFGPVDASPLKMKNFEDITPLIDKYEAVQPLESTGTEVQAEHLPPNGKQNLGAAEEVTDIVKD